MCQIFATSGLCAPVYVKIKNVALPWTSVQNLEKVYVMVAVRTCMVVACSSIDWLLQLPGAFLLIGRAPFVYWGVSNYCALTEVFLLPRIQLCSLHRLSWLLLSYDYRHDYSLVSSMLKLSSLKPSKYTRWILASIGRLVTI